MLLPSDVHVVTCVRCLHRCTLRSASYMHTHLQTTCTEQWLQGSSHLRTLLTLLYLARRFLHAHTHTDNMYRAMTSRHPSYFLGITVPGAALPTCTHTQTHTHTHTHIRTHTHIHTHTQTHTHTRTHARTHAHTHNMYRRMTLSKAALSNLSNIFFLQCSFCHSST